MFKYGEIVMDVVTGFSGVVIGHADYVTGCDQYLIQPRCNDSRIKPDGQWIDEKRLVVEGIDNDIVQIMKIDDGCDISAPCK